MQAQPGAAAQQAGPAQQPPKAGTITIKFVGTANVNEQIVRANMSLREGGEFDGNMLDRDLRSLYRTGLFELIEFKQEAADTAGTVFNFVIEVTPKYRVYAVKFEGNQREKASRLEKEVKTKPNLALDERQVKEDTEKLRDFYQKAGYNQVTISYAINLDRVGGFGTVIFKIREGAKVKIADIKFVGNAHVKAAKLKGEMETKKWWMFSWLTGSGRYKDDTFEDDLDKLRDYYREQGYLDVDIAEDKVVFSYPTPAKLLITVQIIEGRQYRVGEIDFKGNKLYATSLLKRVARVKTGTVFTPSKLDKDSERVEDFYGKDGYLDTRVRIQRKPNVETGNIDLDYTVNESDRFNVESINIEGNTKTKSTVILRELVLGPGDVFSTVLMKLSKLRLENTRFFEDVEVTPQETNIPGRRNMRIAVREGRTGNLTFGAGFSSLERATLFAEVSQSNFDLFNRRSFFQGDGQKFRLRMQIGSLSSEIVLSFEEPWLFQKQLALGFSIFRESSEYNSTFYTQIQTGAEIYVRKNLYELINGRLSYTYEVVGIQDVSPTASPIIKALAGNNALSKVGFQLERDTRDKIINTTRGNRMELNTSFAGGPLGGSKINNFYSLEFRGSQFFPVFETQTQVLSLIARGGFIQQFGAANDVAYYNKFYLGGPTDLRGYEFRNVSPRDSTGEVVGGKSYGFFSAEYTLDIVSPIRFAFFYDAGFVNRKSFDFNPSEFHDNFGFGLGLFVAGSPLRLDFGIPIRGSKEAKKGNQFNFSFGTRY
ncbi:MAG: outer membrane protein assembly factor BamA [Verrucomicrobia bacterium]|nr:outer membrane protein assembly factor BamA [Verrucomicrobiota bacterium]